MNRTSLNTLCLIATALAVSACHEKSSSKTDFAQPGPAPKASSESTSQGTKVPASHPPGAAVAVASSPIAPVNPSEEIPPGPYYPPARSNVAPEPSSWSPKVVIRKLERFFKDAAPAGENRSVHPKMVKEDATPSNRGKFSADQLRPALRQNTANGRIIAKILDKRSTNVVTQRLQTYLLAEDPKTAASAAELVIEEIFATDRKPEVKLYELAGDFDELQRMGYYDEAIAGRRDFLQARLDQAWSSNKTWTSDLPTAILVDVAPALLMGLAAGYRAPVLDGALAVSRGGARLARQAGPALTRNFEEVVRVVVNTPAAEAVEAKMLQMGIKGIPVTADSVSKIEKLMVLEGQQHRLNWTKTPHPDLQYAVTDIYNNVRNQGSFVVLKYKPLGLVNKVAMTNKELTPHELEALEQMIQSSRGTVTKVTEKGLESTELPVEAIRRVESVSGPATAAPSRVRIVQDTENTTLVSAAEAQTPSQPRAFLRDDTSVTRIDEPAEIPSAPAPVQAGRRPRAFRRDANTPGVRFVDEAEAPTPVLAGSIKPGKPHYKLTSNPDSQARAAATTPPAGPAADFKPARHFDTPRAVAGFIGGAALMALPAKVYYDKGSVDGQEREILYLGGQYDKYVPPATSEAPQQTSELKE